MDDLHRYVHDTTNMLVDARMSLFVIYPGLRVFGKEFSVSAASAGVEIGDDDPFSGDVNFGVFVNETGGKLFYNRNDIDTEIKQSQELGSDYYTLTYQPPEGPADGKFRRVRVSLRDPSLRALTKAGYFAPEQVTVPGGRQQMTIAIAEAVRSSLPFSALEVTAENLVRYPDAGRVDFSVVVHSRDKVWQAADDGKRVLNLTLAAASLDKGAKTLTSKLEVVTVTAESQDAGRLADTPTKIPVRLRVPAGTQNVRVVVQATEAGGFGAVELSSAKLAAAPVASEPGLIPRP